MLIYIDFSVLSAIRNYDLEGKDSHCVEICTQPDLKGIKGSPPRNGSNYVKTGGVLMPPKWGCGGQEVPETGF